MSLKANIFTAIGTLFLLTPLQCHAQSNSLSFLSSVNRNPFLNLKQYRKYMGTILHAEQPKPILKKHPVNRDEIVSKIISLRVVGILLDNNRHLLSLIQSPDGNVFLIRKGENIGDGVVVRNISMSGVSFSVPVGKHNSKVIVLKYTPQESNLAKSKLVNINSTGKRANYYNIGKKQKFALPKP